MICVSVVSGVCTEVNFGTVTSYALVSRHEDTLSLAQLFSDSLCSVGAYGIVPEVRNLTLGECQDLSFDDLPVHVCIMGDDCMMW